MDPRKQKRLGQAPIASFEKSLDDNTTSSSNFMDSNLIAHLTSAGGLTSNALDEEIMDSCDVSGDSEVPSSLRRMNKKSGNIGDDNHQIQQQPISQNETKKYYETIGGKRPPPLKAMSGASINATMESVDSMTPLKNATLHIPTTPRIELSRASSSSYHEEDSRDESSPENVFEQVGTGTLQEAIGLGFREEGALELRSSTEELYFMDPEQKKEEKEKMQQQQAHRSSPLIFKFDEHQNYLQQHQRKDSASSEVAALLCISGRTSRVSSIGSQGSAVSRLSAISGVSRSPSPHRMLLETSFCGPKPLENVVDGRVLSTVEPPTAEALEQIFLARKQDPTQAVLAEGIIIDNSPKRKPNIENLSNGETNAKGIENDENRNRTMNKQNRLSNVAAEKSSSKMTMGRNRTTTKSPGQMVIGKTPSGTEYVRINLKPDHMYNDKGIAPNERVVEAPDSLTPVTSKGSSHRKPISLSLSRNIPTTIESNRLTPSTSPKPSRHAALATSADSRSPSPANLIANMSRKSSFSSLFKVRDSPDSPRERSTRSRSKSKDRVTTGTPQSQSVTPSKQKSVLAIFRPKRGSGAGVIETKSKSSSPIELVNQQQQQQQQQTRSTSRPNSRLRYYDEPSDGKGIHIPLHTPPEEKDARPCVPNLEKLSAEPLMRPQSAPITASQLMAAAAALKPVSANAGRRRPMPQKSSPQMKNIQRQIENINAIQTVLSSGDNSDERTWSLEVNHNDSSLDSQETIGSDVTCPNNIKVSARTNLANVNESPINENGTAVEIHQWPTTATPDDIASKHPPQAGDAIAKEKRRLLFATRIGSGSQEQIFSTQFSLSKTESLTSQLSEKSSIAEIPAQESQPKQRMLQRQDTTTLVRPANELLAAAGAAAAAAARARSEDKNAAGTASLLRKVGDEDFMQKNTDNDKKIPQQHAVILRKKDSAATIEESRRKSPSNSEDDVVGITSANHRHSRYLENFDVRKKLHENISRSGLRENVTGSIEEHERIHKVAVAQGQEIEEIGQTILAKQKPILPQTPPLSSSLVTSPPSPPLPEEHPQVPPPSQRSTSKQESPLLGRPVKPPRTSIPVSSSTSASPIRQPTSSSSPSLRHHHHHSSVSNSPNRQSNLSTDEPIESSESDSDRASAVTVSEHKQHRHLPRHVVGLIGDHESTGLVSQDSFDDELPYIPTTLPEERAHGVSLIPVKERVHMELKMCPLDRPRSTTPMNPSHLEEYCSGGAVFDYHHNLHHSHQQQKDENQSNHSNDPTGGFIRNEKLRISLPRKDSIKEKNQKSKSPRRVSNASGKSWFEFAEEGLRGSSKDQTTNDVVDQQAAAAAAAAAAVATTGPVLQSVRKSSDQWINFDIIPEKRKPPKRITTLPKDSSSRTTRQQQQQQQQQPPDFTLTTKQSPQYNYVKPEDCQCECHEVERESSATNTDTRKPITNVDLLQQGEDLEPLLDPEINDGIDPSDSSREFSCYTDDETDVPRRQRRYSRTKSSGAQYKNDEFPLRDGLHSPRSRKFPDNRC